METNTAKDPNAYTEIIRSDYKTYRLYQKALKDYERKRLIDNLEKDKSLNQSKP